MAKLTRAEVEQIVNEAQEKRKRPHLSKANLSNADLRRINLSMADLRDASLDGANLSGANLSGANLSRANLRAANLQKANLNSADLSGAILNLAKLNGADFSKATVGYSSSGDVDLSKAKGLDLLIHKGPSTIGIDTLYLSNGEITDIFLRGAGIPETFISSISFFSGQSPHYYSCFISYSSQNEDFAQRLHADLQQRGVRCWFALEDMKIGDKIRPTIDQSIRVHDKLLIILSEYSVNSQWVEQEVETALAHERNQEGLVLFPVRLDNTVMEIDSGWPALIKNTRHIGDFSQWKNHDAYQRAFERLLRDLKAEIKKDVR